MTKIIIAPDSFKGSLTSRQAARIIACALASTLPDSEIIQCPLADGGEGTADILSSYMPDHVRLIESSQLIGLTLPEMCSIDIFQRGSGALGREVLKGLDAGKRHFVIALGGSATNDAGLGMLMRLGVEAWDSSGKPVEPALSGLLTLTRIDISGLDSRLAESRFTILTDVLSPLCGKNGATAVYGPQKGVDEPEVSRIDRAILDFAGMCADVFGFDPRLKKGSGAADGLGFTLMLIGGEAVSGAIHIIEAIGFRDRLKGVDWVITGEGRSDLQTLNGKLPIKVAQAAREAGAKVALISGSVDESARSALNEQFDLIFRGMQEGMSREVAMANAATLLAATTGDLANCIKPGC